MIEFGTNLNYLDPGTGSYLYQVLIAAGITVGVYFKSVRVSIISFIDKFKDFLNKSKK
tara:strand:- start:72 stop:245 length:174 start_codon:yes stop_codon:yes gene_type:complete